MEATLEKKPRKQRSAKPNNLDSWYELLGQKEDFQNTVHILNRYYELNSPTQVSEALLFRKEIVTSKPENLRIFLKRFGTYEFLVVVEITFETGKKIDSWIHIDGIMQERKICTEQGKLTHPVFNIVSLSDLYEKSAKPMPKGFKLKVEDFEKAKTT